MGGRGWGRDPGRDGVRGRGGRSWGRGERGSEGVGGVVVQLRLVLLPWRMFMASAAVKSHDGLAHGRTFVSRSAIFFFFFFS